MDDGIVKGSCCCLKGRRDLIIPRYINTDRSPVRTRQQLLAHSSGPTSLPKATKASAQHSAFCSKKASGIALVDRVHQSPPSLPKQCQNRCLNSSISSVFVAFRHIRGGARATPRIASRRPLDPAGAKAMCYIPEWLRIALRKAFCTAAALAAIEADDDQAASRG